jgi:prepilin-type N-terminal cleavage/methylation domain-containing protein
MFNYPAAQYQHKPRRFSQWSRSRHKFSSKQILEKGFTIVELLIVIVVIGILAAITIVAYNGVQQRARNVQTNSAAGNTLMAFKLYLGANGSYPPVTYALNCIGQAVTACTAATSNWSRDAGLEAALLTVTSSLSLPSNGPGTASTYDSNLGYIPQRTPTDDPKLNGTNSGFLIYILEGNVSCPVGPVASGGWPNFFTAAPANGNTYYNSTANVSTCWVPLASP